MRKFDKGSVSAPAVVGLVLSCTLFLVCSVLTIMSVLRRLRKRRSGSDMKSPSTDIQIAVLEKGLGVHQPPTQRRRVQKTLKPAHIGSPTEQTNTGGYFSTRQERDHQAADYSPTGTGGDENWEDSEYEDDFEDAEDFGDEVVDETEPMAKVKVDKHKEVTSPFGTLHFTVKYNFEKNALTVTIVKCDQLKNATATGASSKTMDPYVKLQLLPDKLHRAKTRVLRNTNSPVYNEEFTFFGLSYNQLQSMVLHFAVISFDRYSRDEVLGEVLSPLSMIDLTQSDQESSLVKDIQGRQQKAGRINGGEVLLSLCYQPATNRLTCVILKAKGISRKNIMDLADPYVKLYLIVKGQRIAKKKTLVKPQTLNPIFNQSFVFDLPASVENLEGVSLELLLLDFDRLTKNEVLGRLELGPQAVEDSARTQWADIASSPRRQIAHWHKLTQRTGQQRLSLF